MKCFQWLLIPVESIRDPRADDTSAPGGTRLASSAPPLPRHAILEHIQVTESGKKQVLGAITLLASQVTGHRKNYTILRANKDTCSAAINKPIRGQLEKT